MKNILEESFYRQNTVVVAQQLLGKLLIYESQGLRVSGIIIETEAYTAGDPACHAFKGKTERNAVLFGPLGHMYVYFIYGNHFCLNIVARDTDHESGGVLIRALHPVEGISLMQQRRKAVVFNNLTSGPGKLTQAFGINKKHNGLPLGQVSGIYLTEGLSVCPSSIVATPRIGIKQGQDKLWRFVTKVST